MHKQHWYEMLLITHHYLVHITNKLFLHLVAEYNNKPQDKWIITNTKWYNCNGYFFLSKHIFLKLLQKPKLKKVNMLNIYEVLHSANV